MNIEKYKIYLEVKRELDARRARGRAKRNLSTLGMGIILYVGSKNQEGVNPPIRDIRSALEIKSGYMSLLLGDLRRRESPLVTTDISKENLRMREIGLTESGKEIYRELTDSQK